MGTKGWGGVIEVVSKTTSNSIYILHDPSPEMDPILLLQYYTKIYSHPEIWQNKV